MQIGIDKKQFSGYLKHRQHISRHQEHIRDYLRLTPFIISDELIEFIFQSTLHIDQITLLFAEVKQFLKNNKILYPSDDTLGRLVVVQREKSRKKIFSSIMKVIDEKIKSKMDQLLKVKNRISTLQFLKSPPSVPSPQSMLKLCRKLEIINDTGILEIDISWINHNYQRSLAKYVHRCSANRLRELIPQHRYTAIACFLW